MSAKPQHWVLKSEPSEYSFSQLERDRKTAWTGIRNFEARNNLRRMRPGDLALFYHSGDGKEIVGVVRIASEAKPDPTAKDGDWSSVDVEPLAPLSRPVSLSQIKSEPRLKMFALIRRARLSVAPATDEEFKTILKLAKAQR